MVNGCEDVLINNFLLKRDLIRYFLVNHGLNQPHTWTSWALFSLTFGLTACQSLPDTPHLAKSQALTAQRQQTTTHTVNTTDLIERISRTANPNPTLLSGYYPLIASSDAFATRSILSNLANHSIDIQYYIWHNDASGQLLLKDLYNAANRGVKVRLLLDDLNTNPQLDQQLLAFAQHPNIAVRLINPKQIRAITALNFVTALPRYQRRMHNKSMTFDHQLSIIGGRNIGDEYLRSDTDDEFADLDVLLAGKITNSIENSFEQYWQSPLSYDIERLVKPANNPQKNLTQTPFLQTLTKIAPVDSTSQLTHSSQLYQTASTAGVANTGINSQLLNKKVAFRWQPMQLVVDDVKKLSQQDNPSQRLVEQLRAIIGTPQRRFSIISSYFVPTPLGVAQLQQLAKQGVKIHILTNSFNSTDVPIVHSGYSETRKALSQAGIALYELKADADPDFRQKKRRLSRNKISTSLHTKAFAVDDRLGFIGSYNIDPRSANINTELGVVIFDKSLANAIHQAFDNDILNISYRVGVNHARLTWQTHLDEAIEPPKKSMMAKDSQITTLTTEPSISWVNRLFLQVFAKLPINRYL